VSDDIPYTITGLLDGYRSRRFSPREVIDSTLARLVASGDRRMFTVEYESGMRFTASDGLPHVEAVGPDTVPESRPVAACP